MAACGAKTAGLAAQLRPVAGLPAELLGTQGYYNLADSGSIPTDANLIYLAGSFVNQPRTFDLSLYRCRVTSMVRSPRSARCLLVAASTRTAIASSSPPTSDGTHDPQHHLGRHRWWAVRLHFPQRSAGVPRPQHRVEHHPAHLSGSPRRYRCRRLRRLPGQRHRAFRGREHLVGVAARRWWRRSPSIPANPLRIMRQYVRAVLSFALWMAGCSPSSWSQAGFPAGLPIRGRPRPSRRRAPASTGRSGPLRGCGRHAGRLRHQPAVGVRSAGGTRAPGPPCPPALGSARHRRPDARCAGRPGAHGAARLAKLGSSPIISDLVCRRRRLIFAATWNNVWRFSQRTPHGKLE